MFVCLYPWVLLLIEPGMFLQVFLYYLLLSSEFIGETDHELDCSIMCGRSSGTIIILGNVVVGVAHILFFYILEAIIKAHLSRQHQVGAEFIAQSCTGNTIDGCFSIGIRGFYIG